MRHAEREYPHECCGLLIGRFSDEDGKSVAEAYPVCNSGEPTERGSRFLITAEELRLAGALARRFGLDIVGFYHSHPDHPAQWSPTDFEEAHWLGCCYVITSVAQGKAAVTNSFFLAGQREEEKQFEPQTIEVID